MPRYDYRCTSCSHEFELVQSFQEAGSGSCPLCHNTGQRVYHAVPVIYKGSGFYTTDYGRPKPPAENDKTDTSSKETTEKSDAKPASDNGSAGASESKSESASKAASESSSTD